MKTKYVVPALAAGVIVSGWYWLTREAPTAIVKTESPLTQSAAAPGAAARAPLRQRPAVASPEPADEMAATAQLGEPPAPAVPGLPSPDDPGEGPSEDVRIAMEQAPRDRSTVQQRARAIEQRDREVDKLVQSGEDRGHWQRQLRGVRAELEEMARRIDLAASVSEFTCFQAGCYLSVVQDSEQAAQTFAGSLQRGGSVSEWPGGAFSSGIIETDSGRVETTVILYAPSEPDSSEG